MTTAWTTIDVSVALAWLMAGGGIPWGDGKAVLEATARYQRRHAARARNRLRHGHDRPRFRRAPRALRQGPEPSGLRSARGQGPGRNLRHNAHGRRPYGRLCRYRQYPKCGEAMSIR